MGASLLDEALERVGSPEALVEALALHFSPETIGEMFKTWDVVARPEQRIHPDKLTTLWLAGRGFGKNFSLTGGINELVNLGYRRIAIVAPTTTDLRDTVMEGPSGLLAWAPREHTPPNYEPSKRRVTFWNGAKGFLISAEEPARFRGPNFDAAVCDELAAWKRLNETWDMLRFCVRIGRPRWLIGTTPRPLPIIKALARDPRNHVVRGSSYDNARNLAPEFLADIKERSEGTRLGRQEIHAEILDDNPNALWKLIDIESTRVRHAPELQRVAIAVDPATTKKKTSDRTGIISGGVALCSCKGPRELHAFILGDLSDRYKPKAWADAVIGEYDLRKADRVIAEVNQGGDLVEANLIANLPAGRHLPYTGVHATRGAVIRAEPPAALYEQHRVHHVGNFAELEDNLTQWDPMNEEHCPDDVAALVYLLTDLMLEPAPATYTRPTRPILPRRM